MDEPLPDGLTDNGDGTYTYNPGKFIGKVTFTYVVSDGEFVSEPANVTLGVLSTKGGSLVLRRAGGNSIQIVQGSKVLFTQSLASLESLKVLGAIGKGDALTVDFNSGGAFSIPAGLTFDGGSGTGNDVLVLRGTSGGDTFQMLGDQVVFAPGTTAEPTVFRVSGVEQVRFEGLAGDDTYVVSSLPLPLTLVDKAGTDTLDFSGPRRE